MPVQINEANTQVEVEAPDGAPAQENAPPTPDALPRWQELARRDAQLAARTAAWGFDD